MWWSIAALEGDERTKQLRISIAAEMSSTQIAQAQRMAREWLADFKASERAGK
jgi:hypothetical protein